MGTENKKEKTKGSGHMTQEALNKRFSVLRTTLAIGVGILLSIIIIVFVSDDPLLFLRHSCLFANGL